MKQPWELPLAELWPDNKLRRYEPRAGGLSKHTAKVEHSPEVLQESRDRLNQEGIERRAKYYRRKNKNGTAGN